MKNRANIILVLISLLCVCSVGILNAQNERDFLQKDMSNLVEFVINQTDSTYHHASDYVLWQKYLSAPHPSVAKLREYFKQASQEFNVPPEILMAIAQVESNWTQIGPSIDQGWGIMHLVDNSYAQTLIKASELLGLAPQILKDSAQHNIRGMAALIASYKDKHRQYHRLEDWFEVLLPTTGLYNDKLSRSQVIKYYELMQKGNTSSTLWGEKIVLKPHPYIQLPTPMGQNEKSKLSRDYPSAIEDFIDACNYSERGSYEIDTWVNHWIGTGTYAGAISWFHNCDANVSSHFVIRSSDGEITQCVPIAKKAWHCGAVGHPNNQRSIGVEHEATITNPDQWNSPALLNASTQMARYFCQEFSIPRVRALPGIRGHNEMPGTSTACPGTLPWETWMHFLTLNAHSPHSNMEINSMPIYFDWSSEGSGDAQYRIQVSSSLNTWNKQNGFTSANSPSNDVPVNVNTGEVTHYYWSLNDAFPPDSSTVYYWSVKVQHNGIDSYYTEPKSFAFGQEFNKVDVVAQNKTQIFPNPTNGLFTIQSQGVQQIKIFDITGRNVLNLTQPNTDKQIDLRHQAKGIYFVNIISKTKNEIQKLIIE